MAQRHKEETGIAQRRLRQAAQQREYDSATPADAAQVTDAAAGDDGNEQQTGPDKAVKRDDDRRHADSDAMPRRDKAERPAQRRAGAA